MASGTILQQTTTVFTDRAKAEAMAATGADDIDTWRVITRKDGRFVVAIFDGETGEWIGNL